MKKIFLINRLLILFLSLTFHSFSQQARLEKANETYANKGYYKAAQLYEDVIARHIDSSEMGQQIADCYYKIHNIGKASQWYTYLLNKNSITKEGLLRLALLERQLVNYKKSKQILKRFEEKFGENAISKAILNAKTTVYKLQNKDNFKLIPQNINTPASDFGVSFYKDGYVFLESSKRKNFFTMRKHSWTGGYFFNIYRAKIDTSGNIIGKMKPLGKIDEKYNDGPVAYQPKTGIIYFTRNNSFQETDKTHKIAKLKICRAVLKENKFTNIEGLDSINSLVFSTAHPSVSMDGDYLYFASDRPGGYGGMDIYVVALDSNGNTFGDPINLGSKVNTSRDEVFPFYDGKEKKLYFSSEGHFGLGGLDVYGASMLESEEVISIENLGAPINSPYDDFSFSKIPHTSYYFFSSNRPGGKGSDDIYGAKEKIKAIVQGIIIDSLSGKPIKNGMVYLVDKEGNVLDSVKTNADGYYSISLKDIHEDFQLIAIKDGYLQKTALITYDSSQKEYNRDMELMPILTYHFAGLIKEESTGKPLDSVAITIVDNNNDVLFQTIITEEDGRYKSNRIPQKYRDTVHYSFQIKREGYITKHLNMDKLLGIQSEIVVNAQMKKIEIGSDLAKLLQLKPIYFDLNSSHLRNISKIELDKVVKVMNENPSMEIQCRGNTDCRESKTYNLWLSDRRAQRAANYIKARIQNGRIRVTSKGLGESNLVNDCACGETDTSGCTDAQHQANRRTEFIVVKK